MDDVEAPQPGWLSGQGGFYFPAGVGMEIEAREASTILGLIMTILGLGKLYGNKSAKLEKNTKDIQSLKEEVIPELKKNFVDEVAALEIAYRDDITKITRKLVNDDGEPILMSYTAHDISQSKCQQLMSERSARMGKRLDGHDQKLDKILEVVSKLEERSAHARTRHDD